MFEQIGQAHPSDFPALGAHGTSMIHDPFAATAIFLEMRCAEKNHDVVRELLSLLLVEKQITRPGRFHILANPKCVCPPQRFGIGEVTPLTARHLEQALASRNRHAEGREGRDLRQSDTCRPGAIVRRKRLAVREPDE